MTALSEYERLEAPGIWRAESDGQRRDVIVSVGDATLVLYDSAERPLAHWSLAALERQNPGLRPALYRPGPDTPEELELTDPEMIEAIERVRRAIQKRRPHRGRLRSLLLSGGLAVVAIAGLIWLPDTIVRHAAGIMPAAKREELGLRLLDEIQRVAGPPCNAPLGVRALENLHDRLLSKPGRLVVVPGGVPEATHLPGNIILLNKTLVEDFEDPGVVAGYILAEDLRAQGSDPVEDLLRAAGVRASFRLLTTGDIPEAPLKAHAEALMKSESAPVDDADLLARFAETDVSASAYAYARDISGEESIALIEADPVQPLFAQPILRDAEWVSLQGICGE